MHASTRPDTSEVESPGSLSEPGAATALIRAMRDLLRGAALGEQPASMIERTTRQIRRQGHYRSARFVPGESPWPVGPGPGIAIPVGVNNRQDGLLVVEFDPARPPDAREQHLLEEYADDIALVLHHDRLEQERRGALLRLLESEERFRQVFHQTNDAILLYEVGVDGTDHRCLEANDQACRWLGYTDDELRHRAPRDLIEPPPGDGPPPWDVPFAGLQRFDACIRRRDDRTTAEVCLHRFSLLGREVMLVVARDVSEERRLRRERGESLRQIQQNMEQFQILNDQIRNPVQVIIGLADLECSDSAGRIIQQAYEIDEIVRRLDIGWLESAKVTAYLRRYGD